MFACVAKAESVVYAKEEFALADWADELETALTKQMTPSLLRQEGPQQETLNITKRLEYLTVQLKGWCDCGGEGCDLCDGARTAVDAAMEIVKLRAASAAPASTDLLARLRDYHDQVLQGFRHISRVEEADLIQAAIDGLRQNSPMARLRGSLPAEESDAEFDAAVAQIRAVPPAEGEK